MTMLQPTNRLNGKGKLNGKDVLLFLRSNIMLVALALMVLLATVSTRGSFFLASNLLSVGERASILGIVCLGQVFVTLTGGIDLSVSAIMALSFVSIAINQNAGVPFGTCILIALGIGMLFGLVNGLLCILTKVSSWLITLGTMMIGNAIALSWSGTIDMRYDGLKEYVNSKLHLTAVTSIYFPTLLMIVLALAAAFVLTQTRYGMNVYMVGGNKRAAYLSGTSTKATLLSVFVINGFMSALAGILLAYRVVALNPKSAEMYQLQSIAAVVVGGTNLDGGEGGILGTFFGAIVIAMLSNVLNILMVNVFLQYAIMGAVLFVISAVTRVFSANKI